MDELFRGAGGGLRRGDGAHAAPLRQVGAALAQRAQPGYRLYDEADLVRLQQILFYRELGFPLDEIAEIFKDPQANVLDQLRARQEQLEAEIARLRRLSEVARGAIEVQRTGVSLTPGSASRCSARSPPT